MQSAVIEFRILYGPEPPNEAVSAEIANDFPGIAKEKVDNATSSLTPTIRILSVAGDDYAFTYPNSTFKELSRDGVSATYTHRANSAGVENHNCLIELPPADLEAVHRMEPWRLVLRCGGLPLPSMEDYIRKNADSAELLEDVTVDGVQCHVVQWRVAPEDFQSAFYFIPTNMRIVRPALLRVAMAPEFGGAVMRIEYHPTGGGETQLYFEGEDYEEISDGVFFPFMWRMVDASNDPASTMTFDILNVQHVNEPLPGTALELQLPVGTRVRDERPGHNVRFVLGPYSVT